MVCLETLLPLRGDALPRPPESVITMARVCCLAAVDPKDIPLLSAALKGAGEPGLTIVAASRCGRVRKLAPTFSLPISTD